MDVAIWTGLVVVLFVSVAFMGPGLWSESLDYPVVNWFRRKFGRGADPVKDPKSSAPPVDGPDAS